MPLNTMQTPFQETLHGVIVRDPYRWLENRNLPATKEWIQAQQRQCAEYFDADPDFDRLAGIVSGYLNIEVMDQPVRVHGRYLFYRKRKKDEQQGCLYIQDTHSGVEQLLVDPSQYGSTTSVGIQSISNDGNLLAFRVRKGGEDRNEIRIFDVNGRSLLPDKIASGFSRGFAFVNEGAGYFYVQELDDDCEDHVVRFHIIGSGNQDEIVFRTPRRDGSRLLLTANPHLLVASFVWMAGSCRKTDFWVSATIAPHHWTRAIKSTEAQHRPLLVQHKLLVLMETTGAHQRLVEFSVEGVQLRVVVPKIELPVREYFVLRDRIYLRMESQGVSKIEVYDFEGKQYESIPLPEDGTVELLAVLTQATDSFFYSYESFRQPPAIYEYDTRKVATQLWHQHLPTQRVSSFEVSQECIRSKDGTSIPVTLVSRQGQLCGHSSPVVLTSYGGFGVAMSPRFSVLTSVLVELHVTFAVAHVRGGGEFGKAGHEAARGKNRQNSFDDFVSVAESLKSRSTEDGRPLAALGGSNAGLLVAVAMTQRPDLFDAILCIAPLLDMVRYENFDHAARWRDEYGTAANPEDFRALFGYSPYHHIADEIDYPATMFVTGDKDDRCNPAHVRKMAAALSTRDAQRSPVIVDYSKARGHSPALSLSVRIGALTRRVAFLCKELNITLPKGDRCVLPNA